jgi:NADPH:quinone reductase-like Zn-dependent oxidoreductase
MATAADRVDGTMRAMVLLRPLPKHEFSDVEEAQIPLPEPARGEIRVKIAVAGASDGEQQVLANSWTGIFLRRRQFPLVLGWDFCGTVDKIGPGVTEEDTRDLDVGAPCFGFLQYGPFLTQGTFGEYVTVPANTLAPRPADVPEPVAAAAATCGLTALQGLRDKGGLSQDAAAAAKRVLIIGAAGGIGAVAVGIAKRLGAGHVTGICSTKDVERVRALGADQVLDRSQINPLVLSDGDLPYDIVFDTPAVR